MPRLAKTGETTPSRKSASVRQQVAALPLLLGDGDHTVVLVTSRDTGRWVLPKGWPEPDLGDHETAAKEAFEEAGVIGTVEPTSCGVYTYRKRLAKARHVLCRVDVYLMHVTEMLEDWPEGSQRQRGLFAPGAAAKLVDEAELAALLRELDRRSR